MPGNTHILVFQIPELTAMIADYLSQNDIVKLMVTSKDLLRNLEPLLWSCLDIKDRLPTKKSLLRNHKYIQTIQFDTSTEFVLTYITSILPLEKSYNLRTPRLSANVRALSLEPLYLHLQNLIYSYKEDTMPRSGSQFIQFFRHCPRLVQLHIPVEILAQYHDEFLDALSKELRHLRNICIKGGNLGAHDITQFLHVCFQHPNLRVIECYFITRRCHLQGAGPTICSELYENAKMALFRNSASKVSSIKLPDFSATQSSLLLHILMLYCPGLERLDLGRNHFEQVREPFLLDENWYPNLRHIKGFCKIATDRDVFKSILINPCKELGLESFDVDLYLGLIIEDENVLETLANYHSKTLRDIEIRATGYNRSKSGLPIQKIMTKCEKLTRFWSDSRQTDGINYDWVFAEEDILSGEDELRGQWICSNLKELSLVLYIGETWLELSAINHLLKQIGKLTKLEVLAIGWHGAKNLYYTALRGDLALTRRRLAELGNLSRLKRLYMITYNWEHIGQSEVEFMHVYWPHLKEIYFESRSQYGFGLKPHWQWWRAQRPDLQFLIEDI